MRAGGRPGPAGPRRRGSRRRQLPPSVHPAPRAVQRGRHAAAQLRLLPGHGRPGRRRGPRRPAAWKDATSSSTRSAASAEGPLPGSSSSSPGPAASSPTHPAQKPISTRRSPTPPGTSGPSSGPSFGLDHAEWLRRRRRINDAKPVLTEALGTFRRLGARSWAQRAAAELRACGVAVTGAPAERRCPRRADPPATPDRPPGQRRPDRPRDRRPALPLTAHGQLAPVPVLSQARGSQPPPAPRRDRPHQRAGARAAPEAAHR